jgi:hypothetical protein
VSSTAVLEETCKARHDGLDVRIKHIEEHGEKMTVKYDNAVRLLVGVLASSLTSLLGVIALLVKVFVL